MLTSVAGSPTGAARKTNRLTIAKIVAFAAIPIPTDTTTANTTPGAPTIRLTTYLKSRLHPAMSPPMPMSRIKAALRDTTTHTRIYDRSPKKFLDVSRVRRSDRDLQNDWSRSILSRKGGS